MIGVSIDTGGKLAGVLHKTGSSGLRPGLSCPVLSCPVLCGTAEIVQYLVACVCVCFLPCSALPPGLREGRAARAGPVPAGGDAFRGHEPAEDWGEAVVGVQHLPGQAGEGQGVAAHGGGGDSQAREAARRAQRQ